LFSNVAGYSNPEVDRLFEEAAVATSDAKRQELYTAVQKIVVEEVPIAWMIEQDFPTFIDKRLKNVITTGIGVHETFGAVTLG
jgi:peptide/nickel transport system substrate-binding protein